MVEIDISFNTEKINKLNCIINLPNDYYSDQDKEFPMILFLHGIGERGDDINLVKKYGIHRYLKDIDIPFSVLSPQCHNNNFWDMHFLDIEILLKEVAKQYRVDINRICLVGISLGAYGAWNFAMQRPNLFKSIVSVAGGAMLPKYANIIKHIPIYIAHGQNDKEVDVSESLVIAEALTKVGANVKVDIDLNMGHELCTKIFEKNDIYEWMINNI
ncbi:prolyl oligopeptidase family serine peptidase [Clostridium sardiniense]|uniref:carboxylesterase family protein n=1 Tax=Clostridium sardiniense TaxID=29369 RepID=UPI003D34AC34